MPELRANVKSFSRAVLRGRLFAPPAAGILGPMDEADDTRRAADTAKRDWAYSKAWLFQRVRGGP